MAIEIIRLSPTTDICPFHCTDKDLNDFLLDDAKLYLRCLLSVTYIINFVKAMFLTNSRTGCAFVTVDALQCAVPFYLKNGFKPLNQTLMTDTSQVTVPLYYD